MRVTVPDEYQNIIECGNRLWSSSFGPPKWKGNDQFLLIKNLWLYYKGPSNSPLSLSTQSSFSIDCYPGYMMMMMKIMTGVLHQQPTTPWLKEIIKLLFVSDLTGDLIDNKLSLDRSPDQDKAPSSGSRRGPEEKRAQLATHVTV